MNTLDLDQIQLIDFPTNQYYRESHNKTQIVLHHTVSGPGARGDISWWLSNSARIATHFIISRHGDIIQCFNSQFWAHHLGVKQKIFDQYELPNINRQLNQQSISIELDSWGGLSEKRAKECNFSVAYYPLGYRGFDYFEEYTPKQLHSTKILIEYLANKFDIPTQYHSTIFEVNTNALKGVSGIYSHTSYRPDKSDVHPQLELIDMLQTLNHG